MDNNFMKDNRDRYTFGLEEILQQTCLKYNYEKLKDYRDPCSPLYDSDEKTQYLKILKNYCDTQKHKVDLVLQTMGFSLSDYKCNKGNKGKICYEIPIIIAELIYVIAKEDSARGSAVSKLKNDNENLTSKEKLLFRQKLFEELKKDYLSNDNDSLQITSIRNVCDEILGKHSYLQQVYSKLDSAVNQLETIKKRLYAPLIPYDKNLEIVLTAFDNQINKGTEKSDLEKLNFDLNIFAGSDEKIYDANEFDSEIEELTSAIEKLCKKMSLVLS